MDMDPEAFLDAFAREQRAGLGALARLARPGELDPPAAGDGSPPRDPPESGDWDQPLAPPWDDGRRRPAGEADIPDVAYRSLGRWS